MEMKKMCINILVTVIIAACAGGRNEEPMTDFLPNDLRAPAYPLITLHPDLSVWSTTDTLYSKPVVLYEQKRKFPLVAALRVDGTVYRIMGSDSLPFQTLVPSASEEEWTGRYTFVVPKEGWEKPEYNDSTWRVGKAAFGTSGEPDVRTLFPTKNIWIRREVDFDTCRMSHRQLYLRYSHDDVFQLYINGKQLVSTGFEWRRNVEIPIPDSIAATLKDGKALIAAHCENRAGGALADFGVYTSSKDTSYFVKTATQLWVDVQATQTRYMFRCGAVDLKLTFTAPHFADRTDKLSMPVNYITYEVIPTDGRKHSTEIYWELGIRQALGTTSAEISAKKTQRIFKANNPKQHLWVNTIPTTPAWGDFYMAVDDVKTKGYAVGDAGTLRCQFARQGTLTQAEDSTGRDVDGDYLAVAQTVDGKGKLTLGFDPQCTVKFFGHNLMPYWKRNELTMPDILLEAEQKYEENMQLSNRFDHQLMMDGLLAGGKEYAELCAIAYRQTISAFLLASGVKGELVVHTKNVGPTDVYYPASILYLYYNPALVAAMLEPIFYHCESGQWQRPFPPHDLGDYPLVNGQTFGAGLPVEEAGNMLLLTAAISYLQQDTAYSHKHWDVLSRWSKYLLQTGIDAGQETASDVFAPQPPHSANLSAKSILALAAYARMAEKMNRTETARIVHDTVKHRAEEWQQLAYAGDHYRYGLDGDTIWGLKYNLIWDKLLDLHVFPDSVFQKETEFYINNQQTYGVPLLTGYDRTKTEWNLWIASFAGDRKTFRRLMLPVYHYMNETDDRVPMSDVYVTGDSIRPSEFVNRPVVGGVFIQLLKQKMKHKKQNK